MKRVTINAGSGIVLKQYAPGDADIIFQLIDRNRGHLSQFGDSTASKYPDMKSVRDSITNPKDVQKIRFGIWDKDVFVGSINISPYIDIEDERAAEIGYWLGEQFQSKGYIGRAIQCIIQYVFEDLGVCRVYGIVVPSNTRSASVFEKAGFEKFDANTELQFYLEEDDWLKK